MTGDVDDIVDNGPLDLDANVGTILFNGSVGGFSGVFVGSSQHRTDVPSYLDLNYTCFRRRARSFCSFRMMALIRLRGIFASSLGGTGRRR